MKNQVGSFSIENGTLTGPAQYMKEQGDARLNRILDGKDTVFNAGCHYSPSIETAILVSLQTDYAGWLGMKQAEGWLKNG